MIVDAAALDQRASAVRPRVGIVLGGGIARMGLGAVAAGTLANFMSACIAGILL